MSQPEKKISLKQFVWNGFNYIFGITFMNYFAGVVTGEGGVKGVGLNQLWIFAFASFIAYICVLSFKKMSSIKSMQNCDGGAFNYTYKTYGRFWGLFIGFIQIVFVVLTISVQCNMIFKNIFSPNVAEVINGEKLIPPNIIYLGAYTNMFLDIIGIVATCGFMLIVLVGIKWFKNTTKWTGIVKWAVASGFIILGIYMACKNGSSNITGDNGWANNSHLSVKGFINTFNTSFYTLAGFEILVTSSKSLENPEKNMGKGITLSLAIAITCTLILSTVLFLGFGTFSSNMDVFAWTSSNLPGWLEKVGIGLSAASILLMYINGAIQNGLYSGSTLEPVCETGFFSKKLIDKNKNGTTPKATITMVVLVLMFASLILLIPDIIQGSQLLSQISQLSTREEKIWAIHDYKEIFSVSSLSQLSAVFSLIIYSAVILCCFKCSNKKIINLKLYEKVLFCFGAGVLILMFILHYYSEIDSLIISKTKEDKMQNIIKLSTEFFILFTIISFFLIRYKIIQNKLPKSDTL